MTILRIPVTEDIARLRLHGAAPPTVTAEGRRATWLLSLRDQQKMRHADSAALHALIASVTDALEATPKTVGERLDGIAGIAVELGLGVAKEIVGSALDAGAVDPTETVARCLRDCVHGSAATELVVYLNPQDLELVHGSLSEFEDLREQLGAVRFVPDALAGRGAVRVESESGMLRYDPRDVLERISAEVRREVRA